MPTKEKPILFTGEMVRAILDGRKTMTRRVMKPQPPNNAQSCLMAADNSGDVKFFKDIIPHHVGLALTGWVKCPYGRPGDILYVREAWRVYLRENCPFIQYKSDEYEERITHDIYHDLQFRNRRITWRPSIFMPKWASRIRLRVTAVKAERVQDITEEDAIAEGIEPREPNHVVSARYRFAQLWNSINAKCGYSWDSNPYVWVIEFEELTNAHHP